MKQSFSQISNWPNLAKVLLKKNATFGHKLSREKIEE